jgi:putative DNA primase/helicase
MTEDIGAEFARRRAQQLEQERRQPPGPTPEIEVPDLEVMYEAQGPETDKRLADIFFTKYRHLLVNGDGRLHLYLGRGKQWVANKVTTHLYTFVMHMSNDYHQQRLQTIVQLEAALADGRQEEAQQLARRRDHLGKMITYCEKGSTIGTVARLVTHKAETVMEEYPVRMNPDPCLLNCRNGVVDLRTGSLRWPVLGDYITQNTGVDYLPDANTEADQWWAERVGMIAGSPANAEFLQVWFGYCATGLTGEHCMAVMHGNGRNGKNVLMDAVAGALGEYAIALSNSFLESQDRAEVGNNVLYMMAQLNGRRFAYVSETGERGKLRESIVKSLTGDKTIRARLAHQDYFEFPVTHKFTIGTNHKPEISGTDDGVWARIRLIPMRVKFGPQEEVDAGVAQYLKDPTMDAALKRPGTIEAVLRWVVQGARKYLSHGLARYVPVEVTAETVVYRRDQDVLGLFLQQVSEPIGLTEIEALERRVAGLPTKAVGAMSDSDLLRVNKGQLWRAYAVWARDNGHGVMSSTMFGRRLSSAKRFWPGDGTGEVLMKPLEVIRTQRGDCWRWFRWNTFGRGLSLYAEQQHRGSANHEQMPDDREF